MLPSLGIRNYRNLKSLDIERLARVNLIAGKNNTGKTSLLEAVSLYAAGGNLGWINQILVDREEMLIKDDIQRSVMGRTVQPESYLSLFYDRQTNLHSDSEGISIGELNDDPSEQKLNEKAQVLIRMVKFTREQFISENGKTSRTVILEDGDSEQFEDEINLGLETKVNGEAKLHNLERERVRTSFRSIRSSEVSSFQFVRTRDTESDYNGTLWDAIVLTEYEEYVVEALRIIDSLVESHYFYEMRKQIGNQLSNLKIIKMYFP